MEKWRKIGLVVLAVTAFVGGGVTSVRAQQQTRVGYIPLYFADVPFIASCNSQPVTASMGLHYESADDALRQLQALFPQCQFQQIQIGPVPMPAAAPR